MNRTTRFTSLLALALALALGAVSHADGLRDPMRPPAAPGSAPAAPRLLSVQTLRLEGVIAGESRVAIVNGRAVRAGDSVAGARIVEVLANGVRFERNGKISTLLLPAPQRTVVRVAGSEDK